jgi:hypothetical protein
VSSVGRQAYSRTIFGSVARFSNHPRNRYDFLSVGVLLRYASAVVNFQKSSSFMLNNQDDTSAFKPDLGVARKHGI